MCLYNVHVLESVKLEENFRKDVNNPRKKIIYGKKTRIELHLMQLLCCCCSRIMRLTLYHFVISVLEKCSTFNYMFVQIVLMAMTATATSFI